MSDLCRKSVNRGDYRLSNFQRCGRKIIQDGLCSIHLRVKQRREEKDRAFIEKTRRGDALLKRAQELSDALGIPVDAEYVWLSSFTKSGYSGKMVVPLEWLEQIAKEKSG